MNPPTIEELRDGLGRLEAFDGRATVGDCLKISAAIDELERLRIDSGSDKKHAEYANKRAEAAEASCAAMKLRIERVQAWLGGRGKSDEVAYRCLLELEAALSSTAGSSTPGEKP